MKTQKGNSYQVLCNAVVDDVTLTLGFSHPLPFKATQEQWDKIIPAITERIQQEKKPAMTLIKQLSRIELHREQLVDAYDKLLQCYENMVTPQTRTSTKTKAQADMLSAMDDKMLKQFAVLQNVDVSDVILPDDREQLVSSIIEALNTPEVAS